MVGPWLLPQGLIFLMQRTRRSFPHGYGSLVFPGHVPRLRLLRRRLCKGILSSEARGANFDAEANCVAMVRLKELSQFCFSAGSQLP